jgi:hypothetical protein
MLFLDWADRRGPEGTWVLVADTIGATVGSYVGGRPSGRFGAHNGWHAINADIAVGSYEVGHDPTMAVYTNGGQPGTIWDMYGVKASESSTTSGSIGSRLAAGTTGQMIGKESKIGPTGLMLRQYYRIIMGLTGDLNAGNIGPYVDKTDDDVLLLNDFTKTSTGTTKPRAVWLNGDSWMEGQTAEGNTGASHQTWVNSFFNVDIAGAGAGTNYREYAGNPAVTANLTPHATISPTVYGVNNNCFTTNDVLSISSGGLGSIVSMRYPDTGTNPNPKIAGVYTPESGPHPGITIADGFDIQLMGLPTTLDLIGTNDYMWHVFTNVFGALNCLLAAGQPIGVGDNPNQALVNFLALRSENPFRGGKALITFGITRKEKVELKVYDVAGRLVKTLVNREIEPGEHKVFWDGSSNDGRLVSRGVYFYQLRTPTYVSQKKLAVLQN